MALSTAQLKRLRSLRTPKGRREHGCFLIEGEKLVREALSVWKGSAGKGTAGAPSSGAGVVELLAVEGQMAGLGVGLGEPPTLLSEKESERLSDTRTPQGCFAVVRDEVPGSDAAMAALPAGSPQGGVTVVALDGVQDPGNAGALIRVAAAFRVDLVLVGPGSADPVQPKVVRAATGAWFRVAVARSAELAADLEALAGQGFVVLGASAAGESVYEVEAPERRVLVLGSEGGGFSTGVEGVIQRRVGVPIAAGVESLNVAVAAGIVLGEWARRGALTGGGRFANQEA